MEIGDKGGGQAEGLPYFLAEAAVSGSGFYFCGEAHAEGRADQR